MPAEFLTCDNLLVGFCQVASVEAFIWHSCSSLCVCICVYKYTYTYISFGLVCIYDKMVTIQGKNTTWTAVKYTNLYLLPAAEILGKKLAQMVVCQPLMLCFEARTKKSANQLILLHKL